MSEGTVQSIEIPASAEAIFDVLADLERYPEWITAMRSVEVLERDAVVISNAAIELYEEIPVKKEAPKAAPAKKGAAKKAAPGSAARSGRPSTVTVEVPAYRVPR